MEQSNMGIYQVTLKIKQKCAMSAGVDKARLVHTSLSRLVAFLDKMLTLARFLAS